MFGKLNLEEFTGLTSMPQKAAFAWSGFESVGLVGASYKPLVVVKKNCNKKGYNKRF